VNLTIDASVFVAAARTVEIHYSTSREFLREVRTQKADLFCPILLLPECAAAITRSTTDASLAEALISLIESFPRLQLVPLDLSLGHMAVDAAMAHRVRGADSIYISVAQMGVAELVTWDEEMLKRGSEAVTTSTPTQWLEKQAAAALGRD